MRVSYAFRLIPELLCKILWCVQICQMALRHSVCVCVYLIILLKNYNCVSRSVEGLSAEIIDRKGVFRKFLLSFHSYFKPVLNFGT